MVFLSHRDCSARCTTGTDQHGKCIEKHQNRCKKPDTGQGSRPDSRNMPDINTVYNIIKQVNDLCDNSRDCQLRQ